MTVPDVRCLILLQPPHLALNAGPSLPESKSLKAYDERAERQCLAEFAQSKSLERNPSFTRRRNSRQDLNFPQATSLASVLVHRLCHCHMHWVFLLINAKPHAAPGQLPGLSPDSRRIFV